MGVRGLKLKPGDELVGMDVLDKHDTNADLLVITERGIGKKTQISAWPMQLRGGVGVKVANLAEKTGNIVAAQVLTKKDEALILTSQKGQVIRTTLRSVPRLTRDTQGVIIMRLSPEDKVAAATVIKKKVSEEEEEVENQEKVEKHTETKPVKPRVARKPKPKTVQKPKPKSKSKTVVKPKAKPKPKAKIIKPKAKVAKKSARRVKW
ncbi:hypothetical protein A2165_00515 [Candidatus Curtissbacteria bacterium RBG_13_40_7]|uniref:DNA gyrase subunit A n=1 Tax=Candidatus Curtissbacteria bacterium RBG_13_40_7 TaxID=1797706 RepID=A0A1F5FTV1_9BACT|nr:MAG: hypothetical protein A2165_00515 [Candidatus Curtissbacteria bacterium RBG_13_40_7]